MNTALVLMESKAGCPDVGSAAAKIVRCVRMQKKLNVVCVGKLIRNIASVRENMGNGIGRRTGKGFQPTTDIAIAKCESLCLFSTAGNVSAVEKLPMNFWRSITSTAVDLNIGRRNLPATFIVAWSNVEKQIRTINFCAITATTLRLSMDAVRTKPNRP